MAPTHTDQHEYFKREWGTNQCSGRDVILCLHGIESHSDWFDGLANELVARDLPVYSYDRTGWGKSSGERGHLKGAKLALEQLMIVSTTLKKRFENVHLVGLSWGGLLASYAALRHPEAFSSITLIAPGIFSRVDPSLGKKAQLFLAALLGFEMSIDLHIHPAQFTTKNEWVTYINDDKHRIKSISAQTCLSTFQMRRTVIRKIKSIRIPNTLLLLADKDEIIDNDKTSRYLNIGAVKTFSEARHSLVFERPKEVANEIAILIKS